MSPRPDVSEERKDQILDAASEIFAEKGIHEARMDDIVAKSGLSKGTLYWYFKSKDAILLGIFDRMFRREFEVIDKLVDEDGTASERLLTYMETSLKDIKRMMRFIPITYEFLSLAFRSKFIQEAFKRYINKYMDAMVPIIEQGIASGEFKDVDSLNVAIAAGAIFEGTLLLWVYDNTLVIPENHIRAGIQLLMDGIKA
jgi:AcrR family transcriptional regulator